MVVVLVPRTVRSIYLQSTERASSVSSVYLFVLLWNTPQRRVYYCYRLCFFVLLRTNASGYLPERCSHENTLEHASCFKNNFFRKQHTCARLAPATQHHRHVVRTRTYRQPPGVVLWIIYEYVGADLHRVYYCCIPGMLHPVGQLYPSHNYWLM